MATASQPAAYPTIMQVAEQMTGARRAYIEALAQTHQLMGVAPWVPCNLPDGHLVEVQSKLPTVYMSETGGGTRASQGGSQLITFPTAMISGLQKCKVQVAELGEGMETYMAKHAPDFVEAIAQKASQQLFLGDRSAAGGSKDLNGLGTVFNSLSGNLSTNTISGGGAGSDCFRLYYLAFGEKGFQFIYPNDGQAGVKIGGISRQWEKDDTDSTLEFEVLRRLFEHKFGYAIGDFHNLVCIPNCDRSDLVDGTSTLQLVRLTRKAIFRVHDMNMPGAWVGNKTALEFLSEQVFNTGVSANVLRSMNEVTKRIEYQIDDRPFLIEDQLTNSETALTA